MSTLKVADIKQDDMFLSNDTKMLQRSKIDKKLLQKVKKL
jgi:hypothetical protein